MSLFATFEAPAQSSQADCNFPRVTYSFIVAARFITSVRVLTDGPNRENASKSPLVWIVVMVRVELVEVAPASYAGFT